MLAERSAGLARLVSPLASGLSGLLYVCDEPTIGLHWRDTGRLIAVLQRLRDPGNTVLAIEHDLDVIDFGPGAGLHGGQVVAQGTPVQIAQAPASCTAAYLAGRASLPASRQRLPGERAITICGARRHNLQNLTVRLSLGLLVAGTSVSGAGTSSLVCDVLARNWDARRQQGGEQGRAYDAIEESDCLDRLCIVDQTPGGRIPRSNAATGTEVFPAIREAFAATPEARQQGFSARHFSFNVVGGRCERCEGSATYAFSARRADALPGLSGPPFHARDTGGALS